MKSNPAKKFKAIGSTAHTSPIFKLFLKEIFLGKSSKPGVGNMVVILQFEWDGNFDDMRTNILQVLTYYAFSRSLGYHDTRH